MLLRCFPRRPFGQALSSFLSSPRHLLLLSRGPLRFLCFVRIRIGCRILTMLDENMSYSFCFCKHLDFIEYQHNARCTISIRLFLVSSQLMFTNVMYKFLQQNRNRVDDLKLETDLVWEAGWKTGPSDGYLQLETLRTVQLFQRNEFSSYSPLKHFNKARSSRTVESFSFAMLLVFQDPFFRKENGWNRARVVTML